MVPKSLTRRGLAAIRGTGLTGCDRQLAARSARASASGHTRVTRRSADARGSRGITRDQWMAGRPWIDIPPSTAMHWPVTYDAAGMARNATTRAIS